MFSTLMARSRRLASFALALALVVPLAGCDSSSDDPAPTPSIVEVAVANDFNTLVAAVQAAGLTSTLQSDGPFTVFAPTDEAFAALPEGTVETLLRPENRDQLVAVLTYHVVPGRVTAAQVVNLESATTVQGSPLAIDVQGSSVFVNDAQVTVTDIQARNGVVHVINRVLLPPSMN